MKLWLTAQEIADLALDGFPSSKRGVQKLADREDWAATGLCQKREGREGGGGLEYHIDLFPLAQRLDYAALFIEVQHDDYITETSNELTRRELSARDAKLIVLKVAERFRNTSGMGASASDHLFASLYEAGKVPVPDWVKEIVKRVSSRSLSRWRGQAKQDINSLGADPSKARKGTGVLDRAEGGRVRNFCLAIYASNQFFSAEHIRNAAKGEFGNILSVGDKRVPLPPLRTFQNALKGWKNDYKNELLKITDPDAYRSTVRFSATGANRVSRLNEKWEIDASPVDAMTTDGRKNLYMAIDLFSRRIVILITDTPRAAAVGMLIRKCLLEWGVPELIKTDNGSDFVARATVQLLDALGIEQELSAPYSPQQKGTVERVIGTFQRKFVATLPGFIGHSVADRKVIEARKSFSARLGTDDAKLFQVDLSTAELQQEADRWCREEYAHTPHEGLKRKTPHEVAQAWTGEVRAISDQASLDVLLAPIAGKDGLRKVTKQGVKVDGEYYMPFGVMPGTDVFCRHDPADLGRLWLFEPDGETYLGEAVNPDLAGMDPAETVAKVRAMQKAVEEERSAAIRMEKRRINPRTVMEHQRAAYQHNADVLSFPQKHTEHETSKTLAASEVCKKRAPRELDAREAAMMESLQADRPTVSSKPTANVHTLATLETPESRFQRALQFEQRLSEGTALSDEDALWLTGYQAGPEYRAHKMIWEDTVERLKRVPPAS
ncbi:DDE-type integrase/transposase/recombinase [Roseibium porphyridii]|uniref:DDE-type integrase/transposase/recombinase n=1 Tax=Roseibium porphyridii TaxID=2866279 RepID=A0ABY8FAC4_9HYPH|nr:DDE-type integrase/transposase/recombinase [Roseibium sp. KMA01]WFE92281.1 DDE-type integrase/transposase/recombinase [Roseibium sp. KMA01]